jgi:type IV pilus assembly protein PilM
VSALASLFGKETIIGIDIGSANIKAVQVEAGRDSFRIIRAAQQRTPDKAVRDGVIIEREAVATAVRQMLKAAGMSATGAALAVSGPTVVVRNIRIPKMPEAALLKSARYEASKYISANVDDSALAFEIVGMVEEEPNQMEVMIVAAPREMVESRVEAVERAGLEAVSIDLESFALQRSLVDCNRRAFEGDDLRAVIDMGAAHTEVSLLSGARFVLTRSIPVAGDTFTDALKNQLRIDTAEAERIKAEADLTVLLQGAGGDATAVEIARAIQTILDEMLREVRRSVNYYQSQQAEGKAQQPLSEIILSGGASQLRGLATYVTARLGTETRIGNALDGPAFDAAPEAEEWLRDQAPRLGTCLGLAVKEYMHSPVAAKA